MKNILFIILILILIYPTILYTGQGCCSWHDGECGCSDGKVVCCDGTTSPSCTCGDDDSGCLINTIVWH